MSQHPALATSAAPDDEAKGSPKPALRRSNTLTRNWMSTVTSALAKAKEEAAAARAEKQKVFILLAQASELTLAAFLRRNGEYERALYIYEECLFKRVNVLGEDHPDTIVIAHAVGYTKFLQGNVQALALLEESLAKWRAIKGEDHPNTALYQARRDACATLLPPP